MQLHLIKHASHWSLVPFASNSGQKRNSRLVSCDACYSFLSHFVVLIESQLKAHRRPNTTTTSIGCFSSPFTQPATDSLSMEAICLHNNLTTQTTVLFGYPPPETPAWNTWLMHEWLLLGRRDEQFFWHTFSMSLHLPSTIYFISRLLSPCYSLWQYKSPRRTHGSQYKSASLHSPRMNSSAPATSSSKFSPGSRHSLHG
jgi:hypothetical protein